MADIDENDETQELQVPEMWKYAKPQPEDNGDEEVSKPKVSTGPLVGKLVKYLNDIEDPEEFEQKLAETDPATGQTLLMWATLTGKFVLVEWLVKKANRAGFSFHNNDKELTIYDKWIETRKEIEEKEKERLANPPEEAEEEEEDDGEEKIPEPTDDQLVFEALGDIHDDLGARGPGVVKRIGELGVYQGARNEEGAKTGLGQTLFPNGDMYVGEYVDNKRQGTGSYFFANDGIIYTGKWADNLRSGIGRIVYPDGGRYLGNWTADKKHGEGRYTYPDGGAYAGEWYRDKKHGFGTFVFPDGSQHIGTFSDGEFLSGEWRLAGTTRFYGAFANGSPQGKGVFVLKHGQPGSYRQEGQFIKGGEWIPGAILAADATPQLEITIRNKAMKLTFTDESSGLSTENLVHAATFGPFLAWQRQMEQSPNTFVNSVQISSIRFENKQVAEVRAKVSIVDSEGKRLRGTDTLVFKRPTTKLLVVLIGGDKTVVVLQKSPNSSVMQTEQLHLPSVTVSPSGDLTGRFVELVEPSLRLNLKKANTYPIPELQATHVHSAGSDAQTSALAYIQHVHADAMTVLQQRLSEVDAPYGALYKLQAVRLHEVASLSTDAVTIVAANSLISMLKANKLPQATVEAQRPATPIPPMPEPRPDIEPLLEAERRAKVVSIADEE